MKKDSLKSHTEIVNSIPILHLTGFIDASNEDVIKNAITALYTLGQKHIVIDLTQVHFIDMSGFEMLVAASNRMRRVGGTLCLAGCSDEIRRIIIMGQLDLDVSVRISTDDAPVWHARIDTAHEICKGAEGCPFQHMSQTCVPVNYGQAVSPA